MRSLRGGPDHVTNNNAFVLVEFVIQPDVPASNTGPTVIETGRWKYIRVGTKKTK